MFGELRLRRLRILLLLVLVVVFIAFRWWMRTEPFNSDDLTLFSISVAAAQGEHWVFSPPTEISRAQRLRRMNHQLLRIGLLPVSVPIIWLFGPTQFSYYLMPLLFGVMGFLLTWRIMDQKIGPVLALIFALFHIGFLFEIREGTVFLVDLPAAVAMLATLYLVSVFSRRREGGGEATLPKPLSGALIALPLLLGYLLRSNSLILLAPGLVVLLVSRRSRGVVLWSAPWVAAGIFLEQLLYVVKGMEFGFRWELVDHALKRYSPYLPWYDLKVFPIREFSTLWARFGGGFDAIFLLSIYTLALVSLVAMLVRASSAVLRAVAITGLITWGVFSFGFLEVAGGRIHALAPVNFRYFQPFYFSGIIALCWSSRQLLSRLALGSGENQDQVWRRPAAWLAAAGATWILAISFALTVEHVRPRVSSPESPLRQAIEAIDVLATESPKTPLEIYGTSASLRPIRLFRGPWSDPTVTWHGEDLAGLAQASRVHRPVLFLDERRMARNLRYLRNAANVNYEEYAKAVETLRLSLWAEYVRVTPSSRYGVYAPVRDKKPPQLVLDASVLSPEMLPIWQTPDSIQLVTRPDGGVEITGTAPGEHFYVFSGDGRGFPHPPDPTTSFSLSPLGSYEVLALLELSPSVTSSLFVIQYDDTRRLTTESWRLRQGPNIIKFSAEPVARSGRLALRFALPERGGGEVPRIEVKHLVLRSAIEVPGFLTDPRPEAGSETR